jgi:thiol:disulfide interchange protein DsbD
VLDVNLLESALIVQIAVSFLAGFVTFFTPCVYPLVPITLAIFGGGNSEGNFKPCKLKAWLYALGLTTTYTILGILAAHFGLVFGSYMASPIFLAVISFILITMALSTVEVVEVPFFHKLQNAGCKIQSTGLKGAFFSGLGSGLLAAPCVGPTLSAILMLAASSESKLLGSTLMASYAAGLSLPFVALSSWGLLFSKLPSCGQWMINIKNLICVGILLTLFFLFSGNIDWFLSNYLKADKLIFSSIFLLFGILIIILTNKNLLKISPSFIRFLGCALVAFSLYGFFIFKPSVALMDQKKWSSNLHETLKNLKEYNSDKKIVIVKASAIWCTTCTELETKTLSSKDIQDTLNNYSLVSIDFSDISEEANFLSKEYNVNGVPTILFLNQNGQEIKNSRITGFVTAQQLVAHLDRLTQFQ